MPRHNRMLKVAFFSAVALAIHGSWQSHAFASPIDISTPNGLQAGSQFRIIFVTPGSTNAASLDISTYDTFVNQQAAGATYNGQTIHWSAIGSTDSIGASAHIGVTGAAVYSVNGTNGTNLAEVASSDGTSGMWSGNNLINQPVTDLTGNPYTGLVWTGTSGVGTEYYTDVGGGVMKYWGLGSSVSYPGFDNHIEVGSMNSVVYPSDWVSLGNSNGLQLKTVSYQMYGISDLLTVSGASAVPEPSTLLISGLGIFVVALTRKLLKRNGFSPTEI